MKRDDNITVDLHDAPRRSISPGETRKSCVISSVSKLRSSAFPVPAWVVVLAVAIVLIVLGVMQGDAVDVWRKASLICYECIGIG